MSKYLKNIFSPKKRLPVARHILTEEEYNDAVEFIKEYGDDKDFALNEGGADGTKYDTEYLSLLFYITTYTSNLHNFEQSFVERVCNFLASLRVNKNIRDIHGNKAKFYFEGGVKPELIEVRAGGLTTFKKARMNFKNRSVFDEISSESEDESPMPSAPPLPTDCNLPSAPTHQINVKKEKREGKL